MLTPEQVDLHSKYLGGSDAAVACGLSPWLTTRELYYIFRGEMDREPIDPINAFLGHQLEPMVVNWFTEETGQTVRNYNRTKWAVQHDFAMAHPDRIVPHDAMNDGDRAGLEIKTAATPDGWGLGFMHGDDTIPDDVHIQVSHYMEVFRWPAWYIAVFFLISREFRLYRIVRDVEFGAQLMATEQTFMDHVKEGKPPAWDYTHPTSLELMKGVYPGTDGTSVELDETMMDWWTVLEDSRRQRKLFDATAQAAKCRILAEMKSASLGYMPDGYTITQKRTSAGGLVLSRRQSVNFQ
jgi:predicted phage-related endonuclease